MGIMGKVMQKSLGLVAGVALAVWAGGCAVDDSGLGVAAEAPQPTAKSAWRQVAAGRLGSGRSAWSCVAYGQETTAPGAVRPVGAAAQRRCGDRPQGGRLKELDGLLLFSRYSLGGGA